MKIDEESGASPKIPYWKTRISLGLLPVIFLESLLIFAYIPYTIYFIKQFLNNHQFYYPVILIVYHIIFALTQWSLFKTTFTDPGSVPEGFPESIFNDASDGSTYETNSLGEKRKCSKCLVMKPDRNETTIEHFEKKNRFGPNSNLSTSNANIYDKGFKSNFCEVFGPSPWKWFLPIQIPTNRYSGLVFVYGHSHSEQSPLITFSS
eukprot:gene7390-9081_t